MGRVVQQEQIDRLGRDSKRITVGVIITIVMLCVRACVRASVRTRDRCVCAETMTACDDF